MIKYPRTRYLFRSIKNTYSKRNWSSIAVKHLKSDSDDEYGKMEASDTNFQLSSFALESGHILKNVNVNYSCYGKLNQNRDNVLVVCHALTGNAMLDAWWGNLLGPKKAFDTDEYFVICANILGSCYGTTGPTSINPDTGKPYGPDFPFVTVRDTVKLHQRLLVEEFDVQQVSAVIGGSLGGMQTLEWGFLGQNFVRRLVPIACGSHHTAWQIGVSELQRQAIYMDPKFLEGYYSKSEIPAQGMALARQIAMVSYRTHAAYRSKYGREKQEDGSLFQVQSYLDYQGQKFLSRFDVNSYITLTELMDSHDVGRDRGGIASALASLEQPSLVLGVDSDVLYPLSEQQELHQYLPNSAYKEINSIHGHDGFLLEQDQVQDAVRSFLLSPGDKKLACDWRIQ